MKKPKKQLNPWKIEKWQAPGALSLELFKNVGVKFCKLVTKLIGNIWSGDGIPEEMKSGHIISIYKKRGTENFVKIMEEFVWQIQSWGL